MIVLRTIVSVGLTLSVRISDFLQKSERNRKKVSKGLIMASSRLGAKKFSGIRKQTPEEFVDSISTNKFGLTRKSRRCAQCLKFQAEDPSKIGEDEFEKLFCCSICKKGFYCSKICQEMNYPFHKFSCKKLQIFKVIELTDQGECQIPKGYQVSQFLLAEYQSFLTKVPSEEFSLSSGYIFGAQEQTHLDKNLDRFFDTHGRLYLTAIMGQDYGLCQEYLDFASNRRWKSFGKKMQKDIFPQYKSHNMQGSYGLVINIKVIPLLLTLGRDREAYSFLKYWEYNLQVGQRAPVPNYENFKNMVRNDENPKICWENFDEQDFLKRLMQGPMVPQHESMFFVEILLCLVIVKINVIEEMKNKLNERDDFFKQNNFKSKRKFKDNPRILETLTVLSLGVGMDGNSFTKELKNQKDQLNRLLNFMMKYIKGKPNAIRRIWLAIEGDCRKHFLENFQKVDMYQNIGNFKSVSLLALIKYFDKHPTASQIILESVKNKIGFKVEKNFYVNLETLQGKNLGMLFVDNEENFCCE